MGHSFCPRKFGHNNYRFSYDATKIQTMPGITSIIYVWIMAYLTRSHLRITTAAVYFEPTGYLVDFR